MIRSWEQQMSSPAIEFSEVTKIYRKRLRGVQVSALTNASFRVLPGEVCAFLGPNGAGKTTTIGLLMGFFFSDTGEIRVLGYKPGDVRAKAQIGFLPENFAFYKYLTAERLLQFHLRLAGGRTEEARTVIPELLSKVKLTGFEKLKIGKYSRGMVQRLGVAQALLREPRLLVLDEPTSGLDPAGRKDVRDLISTLRDAGKTVFLSSHLLSEVEQVCDRVIIINKGRVIQSGRMEELLGVADRVEIQATGLLPEIAQRIIENGGTVTIRDQGVTIIISVAQKREVAESIWASGYDLVSLSPLRNSLEDLYLKTVGTEGGVA
jgi:ABC-2 type transport system ATP-binding protein